MTSSLAAGMIHNGDGLNRTEKTRNDDTREKEGIARCRKEMDDQQSKLVFLDFGKRDIGILILGIWHDCIMHATNMIMVMR